jgi:hypothetical protein
MKTIKTNFRTKAQSRKESQIICFFKSRSCQNHFGRKDAQKEQKQFLSFLRLLRPFAAKNLSILSRIIFLTDLKIPFAALRETVFK